MHTREDVRILSESASGYIGLCHCCGNIMLKFNNLLMKLKEDELKVLGDYFSQFEMDMLNKKERGDHEICINTPCPNICFSFTIAEISALTYLLNEACVLINALDILDLK